MDWSTIIQALVAVGFFESARHLWSRIVNRKRNAQKAKLDDAEVIQGMSLKLLQPLHHELDEANRRADALAQRGDALAKKLTGLEDEFDDIVRWARTALALLEQHNLTIAPIPIRRAR